MDRYEKIEVVGEGAFGVVFRARDKQTNDIVAVKRVRLGKTRDGVSFTALREIKLLREIHHNHVLGMRDVFTHNSNINIVFDFMESDLSKIIKAGNIILAAADIKSFTRMMLEGLKELHSKWILHRDMKPENLLLDANGVLKLGDFGLARVYGSPDRRYTHQVVTRWYRAPELLFGARTYGGGVDVWAAGCIFAELMLRAPYLPGESDIDQLGKIFAALGTPDESSWPDIRSLPDYVEFGAFTAAPMRNTFTAAGADALDLLAGMLRYDPNQRLTAEQALKHAYFSNAPAPTEPHRLPRVESRAMKTRIAYDSDDEDEEGVGQKRPNSDTDESPAKRPKTTPAPSAAARPDQSDLNTLRKKLF